MPINKCHLRSISLETYNMPSEADSSRTEFLKRVRAEEFVEEAEKQHANLWQLKNDVTVEAACEETHCPTAQT